MNRGTSLLTGRRSSAGIGPLRIKQDGGSQSSGNSGGQRRSSTSSNRGSSVKRLSGGRKSVSKFGTGMSRVSRPSSGYGRSTFGHDATKDPRQLNSRSLMQREIKDIIEFLEINDFKHPISTKMLTTPTTKYFLQVFQFIYGFLDPKYALPAKPEEEIPQIFKTLKYPVTLSKSSMFTVGSPHTWPHILGALHWLVCVVKYALATDVRKHMFDVEDENDADASFDKVSEFEMLFNYYEKTYFTFLKGADTFEQFEQELADNMKTHSVGAAGNMEQLAAEQQKLETELQILEHEPCKLTSLQEQAQMMSSDNERFHKYLQELTGHRRALEQKNQDNEIQLQQAELELEQVESEKNRFQHCLDNQELSAGDVQRLHAEMRQLTNMQEDLEKGKQELDQEIWNEEKQIAKKKEQMEQQVSQYNSMARTLKLIPATAENAHSIDYELKLIHSVQSDTGMMDFTSIIKPALVQLRKQINEGVHKLNGQKLSEEEALEQLTEMVENKSEENTKQEARLQRLETDVHKYKEKTKEECRLLNQQLQSTETKLEDLQSSEVTDLASLQQELQQLHIRAEQRKSEICEEKDNYSMFIMAAVTKILEHKVLIDNRIKELGKLYKDAVAESMALELPEPAPGSK